MQQYSNVTVKQNHENEETTLQATTWMTLLGEKCRYERIQGMTSHT